MRQSTSSCRYGWCPILLAVLMPPPPPESLRAAAGLTLLCRSGGRFLHPARADHATRRLAGETATTVTARQVADRDNAHQPLAAVHHCQPPWRCSIRSWIGCSVWSAVLRAARMIALLP